MGWPTVLISRLLVFLAGAALLIGGGYGIALWADMPLAHSLALRMDRLWYFTAPQQQWWPWVLGAAALVCALVGIALIVAVTRPRPHRVTELAQRSLGRLSVNPDAVADAIASSIEGIDGVSKAQANARKIAGVPTISITITIDAHTDVGALRALLESTTVHAAASFGPNAPSFRYFVRADKL